MDERQLKNYKRYTLVLLLVTTGALVVCAAAFSFKRAAQGQNVKPQAVVTEHYTPKQAASQETPAPEKAAAAEETTPRIKEYHVGIYKGRVGVFQAGKGTPVLLSETLAHRLPQGDIDLLQKGIPADSLAEARAILEDYE